MKSKRILVIISAIIVGLGVIAALLIMQFNKKTTAPTATVTEQLFYDVLGNAAGQQQVRVAMYRTTFANKADAEAKQHVGSESSSVVEVDASQAKVRSAFATSLLHAPQFDIGRCMDGATYRDDYDAKQQSRPMSLQAAASDLAAGVHTALVTQAVAFSPCPKIGVVAGGGPDVALFRVSDGLIPISLQTAEAQTWRKQLQTKQLFTIRDEGRVDHEGKAVRKLSFTPKSEDGVNSQLYQLFAQTVNIEKIKTEQPDGAYEYAFIAINPANTGSIGGYYLIDESTKLPVYSELYGTNPDKVTNSSPAAGRNIGRTKQTYSFGQPVSLTVQSPLELLP